jgi:hypothetical protein
MTLLSCPLAVQVFWLEAWLCYGKTPSVGRRDGKQEKDKRQGQPHAPAALVCSRSDDMQVQLKLVSTFTVL